MTGVAVVFPGQGVQSPGMGRAWADHPAWAIVHRAEQVTEMPLGRRLVDDQYEFKSTQDVQLAVVVQSLVVWEAVRRAVRTAVFSGHSLGQFTALIAAEALSMEDGIRLVARRGEVTEVAARTTEGGMVALTGASLEQAERACDAAMGRCWISNDNAPGQVVIAGTKEGLAAATAAAMRLGVRRVTRLRVGGAFHTPLMEPARRQFCDDLADTQFRPPKSPVVSNTDARVYRGSDGWQTRLADHLVRPVRWRESVLTMAALGCERLLHVGPGSAVLSLCRRTCPGWSAMSISEPRDLKQLEGLAGDLP